MDFSVVVVVLALVALVSPVYLYLMFKVEQWMVNLLLNNSQENQLPCYEDRLEHITVLIMQEKDINLLEELMLITGARRLLLYDLLQEDKSRIVTGCG